MKKTLLKKVVVLPLVGLSICFSLAACNNSSESTASTDDYGIPSDEQGPALLVDLHKKMLDSHTTYITYGAFTQYTRAVTDPRSIDESADDSSKNVMFYSGKLVDKSESYTREHVWACANSSNLWTHNKDDGSHYVDGFGYKGGGSDLYHIRPCTSEVNTYRGNGKFIEFAEGVTTYQHGDGGPYYITTDSNEGFASKVEPADETKGDIARILMYVYVHYSNLGDNSVYSSEIQSYLGNLSFMNVFNSSYNYSEIQALLVKWSNLDPVDATEKLRNNTIEKIQGNRNPFVDHPEYIARCFSIEE